MQVVPRWVRRVDARGQGLEEIDARIVEIGGRGARLEIVSGALHTGHRVALEFTLADEALALSGRVVWADRAADDGTLVVGVMFDDGDAGVRRRIVACMNEHRRREEPHVAGAARRLR